MPGQNALDKSEGFEPMINAYYLSLPFNHVEDSSWLTDSYIPSALLTITVIPSSPSAADHRCAKQNTKKSGCRALPGQYRITHHVLCGTLLVHSQLRVVSINKGSSADHVAVRLAASIKAKIGRHLRHELHDKDG